MVLSVADFLDGVSYPCGLVFPQLTSLKRHRASAIEGSPGVVAAGPREALEIKHVQSGAMATLGQGQWF